MKKISIGSWAYTMGAFADDPILLPEVCKRLHELEFDGISMGGFKPHAHPELYDTDEKRQELKELLSRYNLEVAEYACDLWALDSLTQTEEWVELFEVNAEFMQQMGWDMIRVDSGTSPVLPDGMSYETAKKQVKDLFIRISKIAAKYGLEVVWEFEPGFMVNEPKNIATMVKEVDQPNFSVLYDTCHGHMAAVEASRHNEPGGKLEGGQVEFIEMLKDEIGLVHLIDSDGTLNVTDTSTHAPFGEGVIDFDVVIPALLKAGYTTDWWAIDLCEWPDAWNVTAQSKAFVDEINRKFCSERG